MKHHQIRLSGGSQPGVRIEAETLVKILNSLIEGAQQSVRLRTEGESTRKGRLPAWLEKVAKFEVTGLTPGSMVIEVDAPTLAEADPTMFRDRMQAALLGEEREPLSPDYSGIDVFADSMRHALADERDSVEFDKPILKTILDCTSSLDDQFASLEISGLAWSAQSLRVTREGVSRVLELYDEVPEPQAVRVAGRLDTISATQPWIIVCTDSGEKARVRLDPFDPSLIHSLFNKDVIVSGVAYYRPSGRLLKIEGEYIAPSDEKQALWRKIPTARPTRLQRSQLIVPQDECSGVSAFFGTWPGEESEKELLDAVDSIEKEE